MNLFECKNLTKRYPGGKFTLTSVNTSLASGKITGVVGENGNGKTTLLRVIAGELAHDSGEIEYFGEHSIEELSWERIRERIAYIPQRIPKWHGLLRTNLVFEASIRGIKGKEADDRIDGLLEQLGLIEFAHLKWKEISTGYRLRFQLAKMLIGKPDLLVLDEPIANLDINAQEKFLADLRTIVQEPDRNVSVILSSQQLHEIENVSDAVIFLKKGTVVFSGNVDKIGESREMNEFEFQSTLDQETILDISQVNEVRFAGKTAHVKVELEFSAEDFLSLLIDKGAKIHYFRDISSSTRRLFNE